MDIFNSIKTFFGFVPKQTYAERAMAFAHRAGQWTGLIATKEVPSSFNDLWLGLYTSFLIIWVSSWAITLYRSPPKFQEEMAKLEQHRAKVADSDPGIVDRIAELAAIRASMKTLAESLQQRLDERIAAEAAAEPLGVENWDETPFEVRYDDADVAAEWEQI